MNRKGAMPKELVDLALGLAPSEGIHPTAIPALQVVRSDGATLPVHSVYTPSLCLVIQGEKQATVGNQVYRFSPAQYLVVSVDLPVTGQVLQASRERPFLCLVLAIEPDTVYELIREMKPEAPGGAQGKPGIFLDQADPDLTEAVLRLARCLKHEGDVRVLAPLILREITYRLLGSRYACAIRQLGVAGSQTQRIAKVVEWIRAHFDQPLKMAELAKVANLSQASFFQHFKQVTTLSPLQYQKELRLQEARRLLSTELTDAATAAFRVGYESPSQFSREYARLFGFPPIADLKRMREGAPLSLPR